MDRRGLLTWVCRTASVASAAVIAVPGVGYLAAPLLGREKSSALVRRLCLLDDLTPGSPKECVLTGNRQDAWTLYPSEVLGRVWLVRRTDADVAPAKSKVDAYSTVCPHLGCTIGLDSKGNAFYCPCHKAFFEFSGAAVPQTEDGEKNPSPRDMDSLDCRIVQDENTEAWWVEVEYQNFEIGSEKKTPKA